MVLEILDNPFADSATIDISESDIRHAAPSIPDTKVQDLLRAVGREQFDKQKGLNERFLLGQEYNNVASHMSAELGPYVMEPFDATQMVVEAGALRLLNEGDRTGSFRGQNAAGGSQWDIEGINTNTFNGTPDQRVYQTGETGEVDLIPGAVGEEGADTFEPDTDTQNVFIMGFYSSTNPRAIEHVQLGVDDGERRTAQEVYSHQVLGTLRAQESPSIEYVTDDDQLDINVSATSDVETDFFPYGVDFNVASELRDLGVNA